MHRVLETLLRSSAPFIEALTFDFISLDYQEPLMAVGADAERTLRDAVAANSGIAANAKAVPAIGTCAPRSAQPLRRRAWFAPADRCAHNPVNGNTVSRAGLSLVDLRRAAEEGPRSFVDIARGRHAGHSNGHIPG